MDTDDILAHYGVKGMKWGQKKVAVKEATESRTATTKSGSELNLQGDRTSAVSRLISRMSSSYAQSVNDTHNFTLKDSEGKSIGELSVNKESPTSMNVNWVGVRDEHRGKGYASAAMDAAIGLAREQGFKQVTLEVPGDSPDALHIYEKKGFKKVGTLSEDDAWGGLTNMKLDLTKGARVSHMEDSDDVLAHYGIKGMKWGKRKDRSDAVSKGTAKKSTVVDAKVDVKSLSDQELRQRINRIQMEKQYSQLTAADVNPGKKIVTDLLATTAKNVAASYAQQYAKKGIDALIAQAAKR